MSFISLTPAGQQVSLCREPVTVGCLFWGLQVLWMDQKGSSRKLISQIYIADAHIVRPLFLYKGIIAFNISALSENSV